MPTETGITVTRPDEARRSELGVDEWPIWSHEAGDLPWTYDEAERCFILEGEVTVETDAGSVQLGPGDYVVFPAGLDCVWHITAAVRKHYRFGEE